MDKRVGSEDKESYVELKDCLTLNPDGKILAIDKLKRLTDSFIEDWAAWGSFFLFLQGFPRDFQRSKFQVVR